MLLKKTSLCFCSIILLCSCTVTNNLYVNDPVPFQKGNGDLYLGVGTGIRPKIDNVSDDGVIAFSNEVTMAPNLCLGGQVGLVHNLNLRFAVHLPYILGGFGIRLGPQYSFFRKESKFNMAIGSDLGFVLARDELKIFGVTATFDIYAKGAINADFFLPFCFKFNDNSRIIITPRYSFNTIYIRYVSWESKSRKFKPHVPSLALGLRLNQVYLEVSAFQFQDKYFPNFGLIFVLNGNSPDDVEVEF